MLFRELLPQRGAQRGEKLIEDLEIFENSLYCWAHLKSEAQVRCQKGIFLCDCKGLRVKVFVDVK